MGKISEMAVYIIPIIYGINGLYIVDLVQKSVFIFPVKREKTVLFCYRIIVLFIG